MVFSNELDKIKIFHQLYSANCIDLQVLILKIFINLAVAKFIP